MCLVKKRLYEEAMEKFGPGEESWEEMAWMKDSHAEHLGLRGKSLSKLRLPA